MTWFDLLRSAGIDPTSAKWAGCPFETVAANQTSEIVEDRRNGDLWLLDHSNAPEDADDVVDCPVSRATEEQYRAMKSAMKH